LSHADTQEAEVCDLLQAWDVLASGKPQVLTGHRGAITGLAVVGRSLFSSARDGVRVCDTFVLQFTCKALTFEKQEWSADTLACIQVQPAHRGVWSAFAAGSKLFFGTERNCIKVGSERPY
jgi:hypothetical protein